jgi:hypothetical protein
MLAFVRVTVSCSQSIESVVSLDSRVDLLLADE